MGRRQSVSAPSLCCGNDPRHRLAPPEPPPPHGSLWGHRPQPLWVTGWIPPSLPVWPGRGATAHPSRQGIYWEGQPSARLLSSVLRGQICGGAATSSRRRLAQLRLNNWCGRSRDLVRGRAPPLTPPGPVRQKGLREQAHNPRDRASRPTVRVGRRTEAAARRLLHRICVTASPPLRWRAREASADATTSAGSVSRPRPQKRAPHLPPPAPSYPLRRPPRSSMPPHPQWRRPLRLSPATSLRSQPLRRRS